MVHLTGFFPLLGLFVGGSSGGLSSEGGRFDGPAEVEAVDDPAVGPAGCIGCPLTEITCPLASVTIVVTV